MESTIHEIALEAGKILRSYFGKVSGVREKQFYWDLVTEADLASEAYIVSEIKKAFPGHSILSEEAGSLPEKGASHEWVVDPLDGTTNFTHGYPMVSISIGLLIDRVPTIGVVYNPILDEFFSASKGKGATLNGNPIHVSCVQSLEKSLLATGFAYDRKFVREKNYAEFCHMTEICQGVRRGGSAAIDLAYVAAGRLDGYWERGLKPWDMAAGIVLVGEAGGKVTSYEGEAFDIQSGRILASNGQIHPLLSKELKEVAKTL